MSRGTRGHLDFSELAKFDGGIPVRLKRWPYKRKLQAIHGTVNVYYYEDCIKTFSDNVIIWKYEANRFESLSHPIPRKMFEDMIVCTASWNREKAIKRFCRMTRKQIDLANLTRAIGGI